MRLTTLRLENFLNHAETEIELGEAVNVLAGANEAGKSALVDGIKVVLTNRARGVPAAENRLLARRGSGGKCRVAVGILRGEAIESVVAWTPSGSDCSQQTIRSLLGVRTQDAIDAALDAGAFLALSPRDRKGLVFRASGAELTKELLAEKGVDDAEIARLALEKGVESAERAATEKKRTANRTAEAIAKPSPADDLVETASGAKRLSTIPAAAAEGALSGVRAKRDDVAARIAGIEGAAAAAAKGAESRQAAERDVESARRELARVEAELEKRPKDAATPAQLREKAATYEPAMRESAEPAPAPAALVPVPLADAERKAVVWLEQRLAAAQESPWSRVAEIADELVGRDEDLRGLADELRGLAGANGGGSLAPIEKDLAAARKKLADAEAAGSKAAARNVEIAAENAAAADAHKRREKERAARVQAATKARQEHLDLAALAEKVAEADARKLESARSSVKVAEGRLAGASQAAAAAPAEDLGALREELGSLETRLANGQKLVERVHAYARDRIAWQKAEDQRSALAAEAARFERMEKALRPDGAMREVLLAPLAKLREVLDAVARKMLAKPLRITDAFDVVYDDAPESMASASTRWRIAASIAVALASLSGLRFVVLDEASINVGRTRDSVIQSLLAAREHFDQALVVVSRPENDPPKPPPAHLRDSLRIFRVADGAASVLEGEPAAAAKD